MSLSRRLLLPGLLAGALLRLAALPLPGSGDVLVWKVWSFAAVHDLTAMYGIGGSPPERRLLHWRDAAVPVDYPPLALVELDLAGRIYQHVRPLYEDSAWLNVAVKSPGLAAELVLIIVLLMWGGRVLGPNRAAQATLVFWLNPAVVLDGAVLGYLDAQMAVPAVLALVAASAGRAWLAGLLIGAAVLTKAQAAFVVPAIAAALWATSARRRRALGEAGAGAAAIAMAVIGPYIARGAWTNLAQALGRLATHDMLSAQAANIWWLVTYVLRVRDVAGEWGLWRAITQPLRILAISRAVSLGYPNARLVGLVLVTLALGWAAWRVARTTSLAAQAAWASWSAWAYALLAAQVHENHLYLAVPFAALAAGLDRRFGPLCAWISGIATLNLYLFEGLGAGFPPLIDRGWTLVDLSVVLAVVNVGAFLWSARHLSRAPAHLA